METHQLNDYTWSVDYGRDHATIVIRHNDADGSACHVIHVPNSEDQSFTANESRVRDYLGTVEAERNQYRELLPLLQTGAQYGDNNLPYPLSAAQYALLLVAVKSFIGDYNKES
jgi:hypothetical protein